MFLPSLNGLALVIIGTLILIKFLIIKRRVSTAVITIIGAKKTLQLTRNIATVSLGLVLIVVGSILSYIEYKEAIFRPLAIRNIETINAAVKQIEAPNAYTIDKRSFISTFKSNLDNDVLLKQITKEVALADNYLYSDGRLWSKDNELDILNGDSEGEISIIIGLMKVHCWDDRFGVAFTLLEKNYEDYLIKIFGSKEAFDVFIAKSRESRSQAWDRYVYENKLTPLDSSVQYSEWNNKWIEENN